MARKKSRVKSTKRSELMKARWADPEYKKKMADKAKAQRDRELARKREAVPPSPPASDPPAAPPAPEDPPRPTTAPAPKSGRRGFTPGRTWR